MADREAEPVSPTHPFHSCLHLELSPAGALHYFPLLVFSLLLSFNFPLAEGGPVITQRPLALARSPAPGFESAPRTSGWLSHPQLPTRALQLAMRGRGNGDRDGALPAVFCMCRWHQDLQPFCPAGMGSCTSCLMLREEPQGKGCSAWSL